MSTTKIKEGCRAMDEDGQTGTVLEIQGDDALLLYDTQRPSSDPKPVPLKYLRFVST